MIQHPEQYLSAYFERQARLLKILLSSVLCTMPQPSTDFQLQIGSGLGVDMHNHVIISGTVSMLKCLTLFSFFLLMYVSVIYSHAKVYKHHENGNSIQFHIHFYLGKGFFLCRNQTVDLQNTGIKYEPLICRRILPLVPSTLLIPLQLCDKSPSHWRSTDKEHYVIQ